MHPEAVVSPRRWALLVSERYALPILRPLAACARGRGHDVRWLASDAMAVHLAKDEIRLRSPRALRAFAPEAVFATVNRIPPFFPGVQVQLFHGLNLHKRDPREGQFRIQDLFDLYCSHGPATTGPLEALAREHGNFSVVETGWPKLDLLFAGAGEGATGLRAAAGGRPVVMFASTFNEPLSQARASLPVLRELVARGDRYWLLTLHPMSPPELRAEFEALGGAHAVFLEAERMADMLHAADVLVCDTTSVVEEFALLGKPVVTLRHRRPQAFMYDLGSADLLDDTLGEVLADPQARRVQIDAYAAQVHPSRDGGASDRVLDAVEQVLRGELRTPRRRWRPWWRRWWRARKLWREILPG